MMWMCEHVASASWLCLGWIYHCKYLLGGSRISCLVGCWNHSLRDVSHVSHWDSMRDGKLAAGKTFCARARHNNRQRHYLCLNDHYAKLCKSVGACSRDSLTSSLKLWKGFGVNKKTVLLAVSFPCVSWFVFESLFEGKGLIEQVLASCQVPSSTILAHVMECPVHYLQTWEAKEIENSLGDKNPQMEPRHLCWHVFWCFLASPSGTQRTECAACAAWSEDFNEWHEVKYPCRKATSFCKLSDFADCGQLNSRCTAWVPTSWS